MTAPNIAAITASLERSLQSFSLNNHHTTTTTTITEESHCHRSLNSSDASLDLNSNMSLPYHWEQCLDLKTGEMYYINWMTGMKSKEHPRTIDVGYNDYFYSDYEDEGDDDESSYADSESSSVESSPAATSSKKQKQNDEEDECEGEGEGKDESRVGGHVLVVAGCKGCFMYFMVPKQVEDCPKCCGQLLHFDRSDDNN